MILIAQLVSTSLIGAWLWLGARDNIFHPDVNETYTAEVMAMRRLRDEYPDAYARVAHRAVSSRWVQRWTFRLVVMVETLTVCVLVVGAIMLLLSLLGFADIETARIVAFAGGILFVTIWAGFLIVGNHFCYWFCHVDAQNTHFQMTLWGMAHLILLGIASG